VNTELILLILQQETTNSAQLTPYIDLLVEELALHALSPESCYTELKEELESLRSVLDNAVENVPLIMDCVARIVSNIGAVADANMPFTLSAAALKSISTMKLDAEIIALALTGRVFQFETSYSSALTIHIAYLASLL